MSDRLVWIDCEMTGLDLGDDLLIEVAALVTDSELNVLGEGVDVVIGASASSSPACPRSCARCTPPPA
jgi:oligoribonuclease